MASMIARNGAKTEKHPLTAHAQGINLPWLSPRILRANGNGIPMGSPRTKSTKHTNKIRKGNETVEIIPKKCGRTMLVTTMRPAMTAATHRLLKWGTQ
jgi:hypothetical protein